MLKRNKTLLVALGVLGVFALVIVWYQNELLVKEHHLQMGELARLICLYIEINEGAYPESFDDLANEGLLVENAQGDYVSVAGESPFYLFLSIPGKPVSLADFEMVRNAETELMLLSLRYPVKFEMASAMYSEFFEKAAEATKTVAGP